MIFYQNSSRRSLSTYITKFHNQPICHQYWIIQQIRNRAQGVEEIGCYGRQIGHIAEALQAMIKELEIMESKTLVGKLRDILQIFLSDVAKVRDLKQNGSTE